MRSYLTIDFLISLGMFFTTIIILSHIVHPISTNQGKQIIKNTEQGTSKFFKNLSEQYVTISNNVIFNYSMIGYNPFALSIKWYTLCTLYNTTKTAICSSPPCPIQFYAKKPSPYTSSVPSDAVALDSSDIISIYYLPMIGFFMPVDQNGNNFASPLFEKYDLQFYKKSMVEDVESNSPSLNGISDPNATAFKLSLTYLTNSLSTAQTELTPAICKKYGCVLYERITFKASEGTGYFIYVDKCNGYCLVFFNGLLVGSIAPYTGMYIPTDFISEFTGGEGTGDYTIVVASIIDKQQELPAVSFKIYKVPFSTPGVVSKCFSEYIKSNQNTQIITRQISEKISPPIPINILYSLTKIKKLILYKLVHDKKSDGEIFIKGMPFYSVYFNDKNWESTTSPNIGIPGTSSANGCRSYTTICSSDETFIEKEACKNSVKDLEQPSRIAAANDLLVRIPFSNRIYENTWLFSNKIAKVILMFRSDDGADVWFNGAKVLNRIHDNQPYTDSLYGVIITPSNYTMLWYVTHGPPHEKGCKVIQTPSLFRTGKNVLAIWVANGGDENWGCGGGGLYIRIFRIYEKLEF